MKIKLLAFGAALALSAAANAAVFTVTWSGAPFNNGASAIGHFDFSATPADLGGAQNQNSFPSANVQLLDLTISGATTGNGSFAQTDFASYYFASFSQLDYSQELIGQAMGNGCSFGKADFCSFGQFGDFNLFGQFNGAPTGTSYFTLSTAGGDRMIVTSMASAVPSVPEPASWAMLIAGFGLTGAAMRRRRITVAA
ncbi:MAG: hypothetical protein DCF31_11880 [Alphaproteobacteria bacterium]|nr:MAG: hypothetical protein DCF31_11880 [Alphaproteobacteria bacterium]